MKIYLVLVGLTGGVNLGLIARLTENFDAEEIRLVEPEITREMMEKAWIFSARARKVLDEKIKVYNKLSDAVSDLDIVFATSAVTSESGANVRRRAITPMEAAEVAIKGGYEKVGIVFGREATGLTNEEIDECDMLITIESSPRYRALNIANSVAVILYVFFVARDLFKKRREPAPRDLRKRTVDYFHNGALFATEDEEYAERVARVFTNILNRSSPDNKEIKMLIGVFRRAYIKLKRYKSMNV